MFAYYLRLAWKSLRTNSVLTALMVSAIAVGIGVCMTTLTIYHVMSNNPIPHKSDVLFAVTLDSWDPVQPYDEDQPEQAPWQVTYQDAMALRESDIPTRHVAMYKSAYVIQPEREDLRPCCA